MTHAALARITLPRRGGELIATFRNMPAIMMIEQQCGPGSNQWMPAFVQACDAASLALFGITEADTILKEPHPDNFQGSDRRLSYRFANDEAFVAYDAALTAWHKFQYAFGEAESEVVEVGAVRYWARRQIDITDGDGLALRCFPRFARQLLTATHRLMDGAAFTPNGTGKRRSQTAEEWGASLQAEAARFRPPR